MRELTTTYDVVVCGAGLAGICAAIAAARQGARTVLIGDRPVLGGNSSSEIRVIPRGAAVYHAYARETGIVSELLIEERARNHEELFENGWTNSVWDLVLYDAVMRTDGLDLHLDTSIVDVETDGRRIEAARGRVANAETEITFRGTIFVDCTGDGVVADLAGCEWRMGTESRAEFDEPHAPLEATDDTMGSSIHFKTKDVGRPVRFEPPAWAVSYDDASFFYEGGRFPHTLKGGYWWIEIGVPWHTIHDNERIRHELLRHALGIWDWIKNKDPKLKSQAATYALDWIGQVPGKRESRRIMGLHLLTEHDLFRSRPDEAFPDEVAYGGWNIDLHTPGGLLAPTSEPTAAEGYVQTGAAAVAAYVGPLGLPLRSFIARDADNLMMAGRNVSATHVGLGSIRVQATTALMGQAVGTAAAQALHRGRPLATIPTDEIEELQQTLLRDGCFLPNVVHDDPLDLARSARVTASSNAVLVGVGPQSRGVDGGLVFGDALDDPTEDVLTRRRGQWIAAEVRDGRYRLDTLELCLTNDAEETQSLEVALVEPDHIWDYRTEPGEPVTRATLHVPPGGPRWVAWPVGLDGPAREALPGTGHRFLRVDLGANPHVRWHRAGAVEPGQVSAFEMAEGRMRRYLRGATMSFRVTPPQAVYGPGNVISGESRPHRATNLWRSDPRRPLSQWLELSWEEPRRISDVELTFAGNLLRDYEVYPPHYRDPQCVRDYRIQ
ncbi:MAG TPA: FAD-dependent oxidoreductase, partial [Actinopolymorphaceae bacterium]